MSRSCYISGFILLFWAVFSAGCASTSASGQHHASYNFASVDRTAVVAVEGAAGQEAAQNQIATMFNQYLMGKGYSPVERAQIQEVIEEQRFGQSELTSPNGAARLGRILNVDTVVLVNVPNYGETMSMSAQMVDTENAAIVWSASGAAKTGSGLNEKAGAFLGAVGGAVAGSKIEGTTGAVVGGATGGAGGALAGAGMTPQRQEQATKLIEELVTSLPNAA